MEGSSKNETPNVFNNESLRSLVEDLEGKLNRRYQKNERKAGRHKRSVKDFLEGLVEDAVDSAKFIENAIKDVTIKVNLGGIVADKVVNLLENLIANAVYDYGKGKFFPEDAVTFNVLPRDTKIEPIEPVTPCWIYDDDWRGLLKGQALVARHIKDVAKMLGENIEEDLKLEYNGKSQFVCDLSASQIAMEKWLVRIKDVLEGPKENSN